MGLIGVNKYVEKKYGKQFPEFIHTTKKTSAVIYGKKSVILIIDLKRGLETNYTFKNVGTVEIYFIIKKKCDSS